MAKAGDELSHWPEYDYVVLNDDIDRAFAEVRVILSAERHQARASDRALDVGARPLAQA
jgi:guanylate kinase